MIKDKSIFIKNIYYMLSYAFMPLNYSGFEDVEKEKFDNIHNLFAAILSKGIGRQLKQGLYREYIGCTETTDTMCGKIEMQGTIANKLARQRLLTCEFDELSENNMFNQIIKTTVMLILRCKDVKADNKSELKKKMLFFNNVDLINPTMIRWSVIRFRRNNNTYRLLLSICQLILEGMLLTTDTGEYHLASFINPDHMSRLYEKFILEYYAKEHPEIKANAPQIPWAVDDGYRAMLPAMQSDIVLTNKSGDRVLIIDAKYYTSTMQTYYNAHTYHSSNMYQIFTYVKNKEASFGNKQHEVCGMLLYARTDEEVQPDGIYQMSGNQIGVHTLDLNRKFSEIAAQLDHIVEAQFKDSDC